MRSAEVRYKGLQAGLLVQYDSGSFSFQYTDEWMANVEYPSISLTLPKKRAPYRSKYLMPFFFNILPEGGNKKVVCQALRIEDEDYFGLLLATAGTDTIGAITIHEMPEPI